MRARWRGRRLGRLTLLLAAREVDATLANLGCVAGRQDADVGRELARVDNARIGGFALRRALVGAHAVRLAGKDHVLAHARVEHPRGLRHVGHAAADVHAAAVRHLAELAQHGLHERALAAAH